MGRSSAPEEESEPGELRRLRDAGIRPRRRLGQHFLFNPRLLDYIIDQAAVAEGTCVLEVGPGSGALTRRLLARGARVTAVEIDRGLCAFLRQELAGAQRFRLIEGDVLSGKHSLGRGLCEWLSSQKEPLKVVANLPFGSATPFLVVLLESAPRIESVVVTVQLEVADRLSAAPGGRAYGTVSARVQVLASVEKLKRIGRTSFVPPPKVDAAVVRLRPLDRARPPDVVYRAFRELVGWSFSQRRKKLEPRLLSRWPGLAVGDIVREGARPADVGPETYLEIARRVSGDKV